ncbi:ankyrin-3-like [Belonocnema kinseyi]|uniref:ankyrin-3-like n=1 Tax=Belonocnema kinseyi TaxID=2817044 RepID=UPI00143DC41B|nr:ankyrin-3-like [Belonocnema kinseyi]
MDDASYLSESSGSESIPDLDELYQNGSSSEYSHLIGKQKNYNIKSLEKLIDSNSLEDKRTIETIIIECIKEDDDQILEFFAKRNCNIVDVSIKEKDQTALHIAYYYYANYALKMMIDLLPSGHMSTDSYGLNYLHVGCWANNKRLIQKSLKTNVDVNAAIGKDPEGDRQGYTALHFASASSLENVELLLKHRADPNVTDDSGRTLLHVACSAFHLYDSEYADAFGREPDLMDIQANLQIINLLLANGCDINAKDKNGNTPILSIFPQRPHMFMPLSTDYPIEDTISKLRYLIQKGADVNLRNNENDTVLHHASRIAIFSEYPRYFFIDEAKHAQMFEIILNLNEVVDVNTMNAFKETPLQLAVSWINVHIVKLLLNRNADLACLTFNHNDQYGFSCLTFNHNDQYGFCYPNEIPTLKVVKNVINMMEMLIDKGFKLSLRDHLVIIEFLVHDLKHCECLEKFYCNHEEFLSLASPIHLKTIVMKLVNEIPNIKIKKAHLRTVKSFFYVIKKAGFFIDRQTTQFLDKIIIKFTFDDFDQDAADIDNEIILMKSTTLLDNFTLFDLLMKNPHDIFKYVINSNIWELQLEENFPIFHNSIKAQVAKSLTRMYIENSAYDYFTELFPPLFPSICSKLIMNYLSNEDILHFCSAAAMSQNTDL